jgi:hypothetical protein
MAIKHSHHHKHMKGTAAHMHKMHEHKHMVGTHEVSSTKAASGFEHLASGHPMMPKNHKGK